MKNKIIKSSELIEIIEARIEEMFSIINKDITNQGLKQKINNVIGEKVFLIQFVT